MPTPLRRILIKTAIATGLSIVASLGLAVTVVPALGGVVDGNAWLMCILCPLLIAAPASAFPFRQNERLRAAHDEIARLHERLGRAHGELSERARRDGMTGMLNRESFMDAAEAKLRQGGRGVLLLIDADRFKAINDVHGHQAGDAALLAISDAIRGAIRGGEIAGRIGGEEFAIYLPGLGAEGAESVAERIRSAVSALNLRSAEGEPIALSVSIGGAGFQNGASLQDLIAIADRELYRAKDAGRDAVRFAR